MRQHYAIAAPVFSHIHYLVFRPSIKILNKPRRIQRGINEIILQGINNLGME
jgi:hypothetical protein